MTSRNLEDIKNYAYSVRLVGVLRSIEWEYLQFPQRNPISLSLYLLAHRNRHFQKCPKFKRTAGSGVYTFPILVWRLCARITLL